MQHHIEYDPEANVLIGTTSGAATLEGVRNFAAAFAAHPDLPNCIGMISDHRSLDAESLSSADIRSVVDCVLTYNDEFRGKRYAHVVSRDLQYGLGRMFQILGEESFPFPMHVCRTLEEAGAWIASQET